MSKALKELVLEEVQDAYEANMSGEPVVCHKHLEEAIKLLKEANNG